MRVYISDVGVTEFVCVRDVCEFLESFITFFVLPGESQGWRSLVGCHLWDLTESDTTEAT